jgi:hypothetical protein
VTMPDGTSILHVVGWTQDNAPCGLENILI